MTEPLRIDKWLWVARFFKTRSLAQAAVKGGHVDLNGRRCKPAATVTAGDRVRLVRGEQSFDLEVLDTAQRRGPAATARTLYRETAESIRRRAEAAERKKMAGGAGPGPQRRPDKRERRQLRRLLRDE